MSKDTHILKDVRGGKAISYCGKREDAKDISEAWMYWGVCPKCKLIVQAERKRR